MRYHVYIRINYQFDPFIETVGHYFMGEDGSLKLYDKGKFWFFPASVIQYLYIMEVKNEQPGHNED